MKVILSLVLIAIVSGLVFGSIMQPVFAITPSITTDKQTYLSPPDKCIGVTAHAGSVGATLILYGPGGYAGPGNYGQTVMYGSTQLSSTADFTSSCATGMSPAFPPGQYRYDLVTSNGTVSAPFIVTNPPDNTPPVITTWTDNDIVKTTDPTGAVVGGTSTYGTDYEDSNRNSGIKVTDDVGIRSNSFTCNPPSGSFFHIGTTTVTCTATDYAGNVGTKAFTVTVTNDVSPPVVSVPANMQVNATSSSGAVVNYPQATTTDNVGVTSGPTCTPVSGSTFPIGTTTVTCTASDAAGNAGTGTFTITVKDVTPPIITVSSPITVQSTSSSGASVTYNVSAVDAVDGSITPVCTPISGSNFVVGTTTVTCVAHDAAGNIGIASFTVTVNSPTPQPASQEITSFITDKSSYSSGNEIHFSGTTANSGAPITILIYDPNNKFVMLTSGIANSNNAFQVVLDTSTQDNQQKFLLQGTYTVTAFTTDKIKGATTTFYFSPTGNVPTPSSNTITIAQGSGASASAACVTTNNCFAPNPLYILPGTTVTWKNTDTVSHTVTSGKVSDDNAGSMFDSGLIKTGSSFQFTFSNEGTYNYVCTVHPWMIGQVIVGNGVQPTPHPSSTTIATDKSFYSAGDSIVVSGTVNPVNPLNPNQPVTIQTYNANNELVRIDNAIPTSNGKYSVTINAHGSLWQSTGTYTLKVQYDLPNSASKLTFYFNAGTTTPSGSAEIDIAPGSGASASAACVTTNNCFAPNPITVAPGTEVEWKNTDTVSHTVTSGKVSDDNAGSMFDSGLIKKGAEFKFTFATAGTYNYFCTVHPWMIGTVVVGNGLPVTPPVSQSPITITTDKSSYQKGDTIIISGTVSSQLNVPISMTIKDSSQHVMYIGQTNPNSDNTYSIRATAGNDLWTSTGTYEIEVIYGGQDKKAQTTFQFYGTTTSSANEIDIAQGSGSSASADCVTTNSCFSPNPFYVASGTTVTWKNTDTVSHTVTSGKVSDDNAGSMFDSGLIKKGNTFQFTFTNTGTYDYFCTVHPWMVGQVVVGAGGQPVTTPTSISVSTIRPSYHTGDIVTATVVLSGANVGQNIAISFDDPTGNTIITRTVTTDNSGSANSQFKIPMTAKVGTYQVVATASVNGKDFNTSYQFSIQQKAPAISIVSVTATDQQGNLVSSFSKGSTGYVKVVLAVQENTQSLVTVNLFDSQFTTLGIGSFKTTLSTGQTQVILSFPIPNDAVAGTANIYTDAFTDWPSNGGKPLTGESASTVEIK